MHFHLPKPMHGWREFIGEVGIIVVGVLIALGAEQVVEGIHIREEVNSFRETIDHEIALNLFVYQVRERQFACERSRIRELTTWLDRARSEATVPALAPRPLVSFSFYRSAWENRNAEVFNHLPQEVRQEYAEFYDELTNNANIIADEKANWRLLSPYAEAGPIGLSDRRIVGPVLGSLAAINSMLMENLRVSHDIARDLHVSVTRPENVPADELRHLFDCASVIGAAES